MSFKGFKVIKLIKAVDDTTGPEAFTYETIVHDVFGRSKTEYINVSVLDRDWCKLRMGGDKMAVLHSNGTCQVIDEAEYVRLTTPTKEN